jgi:hypothetical protein
MYRAIKYGCSCADFIKNLVEPGWTTKAGSDYDLNGLMHYPSRSGYSKQSFLDDNEDCPLCFAFVRSHIEAEYTSEKPTKSTILRKVLHRLAYQVIRYMANTVAASRSMMTSATMSTASFSMRVTWK